MTISISPTTNPPSVVTWYKYTGTGPCPPTIPFSSLWVVDQNGGDTYNTNALTITTCYVAVVNNPCFNCITNVRKIIVCPGLPGVSITPIPVPIIISGVYHACLNWTGTLNIPAANPCQIIDKWEKSINNGPWTSVIGSLGQVQVSTGSLTVLGNACTTTYSYRVLLTNSCGSSYASFTIVIDNKADPGIIQTLTPLTYDIGTRSGSPQSQNCSMPLYNSRPMPSCSCNCNWPFRWGRLVTNECYPHWLSWLENREVIPGCRMRSSVRSQDAGD